jgi:signal transduction histidine kinase
LAQVIGNLLSNAVKYTPEGSRVSVTAGRQGDDVWIQVSDTGIGIAPEEQAHIFTPFYRGSANARFDDGMGLGLSIAQDLVAAHGGRLTVMSQPGAGSQFTIWLPVAPPEF